MILYRAFGRIGSSYEKLGDRPKAILNYQKSLTEHRTPDILTKLRAAEKAQIKAEKDAYLSPEEAEKARELGNQKFKDADWPAAVDAYTEMTKRAPEDPRGYSNRAAALIKLMAFPGAVQDCEEAIQRDPKFIRAYLRKAQALFAMKEYNKCLDVCAAASENDPTGASAREIDAQQQKALEAQFSARAGETEAETSERIQKDPEVSIHHRLTILPHLNSFLLMCCNYSDHGHPPGPGHAEHLATGPKRPSRTARAHEERYSSDADTEADCSGCDQDGEVNGVTVNQKTNKTGS